ncbi:hypothetical protein Q3G72_010169 [Acer saccharum]|nr:hypothetical protein Q3G72_010169 [Acer saccharum]
MIGKHGVSPAAKKSLAARPNPLHQTHRRPALDPSSTRINAFRRVGAHVWSLRSTPVVVDQHAGVDQWRETVDRRPGRRPVVQNPRHGKNKEEGRRKKEEEPKPNSRDR